MDGRSEDWLSDKSPFELIRVLGISLVLLIVLALLTALILGTLGGAWVALEAGDLDALGQISNFLSALVSIALVLVTMSYVYMTASLVDETREAREQNERLEEERREREKTALRRALLTEMEEMHAFREMEPDILPIPPIPDIFPTTVYEANSDSVGLLTDEEAEAVIRFYTNLMWFKGELRVYLAKGDDPAAFADGNLEHIQDFRDRAVEVLEERM